MSKLFIYYICFVFLTINLNAKSLSLEELIEIALENNTNIQLSKNQKDVSEQRLRQSQASYLPYVTSSANTGEYDIKQSGVKQDGNATSVSVNANQLIYDFGKTTTAIKASKYNVEASQEDVTSIEKQIILAVKKAYFDILNRHQQIVVAKEAVKLDELQLSQAKEYFKAGIRTQIDITNAQLQLSNSNLKLIQANYDLKKAKTNLISILGKAISEDLKIQLDEEDIKLLAQNAELKYKNVEELIDIAIKNRAEMKKYESLIKANKESVKNANYQYLPTIDVSASYNEKDSDDISTLDSNQTAVLLNVKWDIFTGFSRDANKKIALSNLSSSYKQKEQQELSIIEAVTNAHLNTKQSFESIKISLLSLNLATKNLDLASQRYQAGLNDLLELNDAKLQYTQAKSNLVNTYYSHLVNNANLEYTLGLIK